MSLKSKQTTKMKSIRKVDVIRPRSLRAIIGPSGTLRRIIKNREYFLSRGYDFEVFTHDNIYYGTNLPPVVNKIQNNKISVRLKITSKIRQLAKRSYFLSKLYVKKELNHIQKLVNYYLTLNRAPDIVAFHSVFECYQFLKLNKKNCKVVCFFHSDGIPFKMTLYWFPRLKNTRFFSKLYEMEHFVAENADKLIFITHIGQSNFLKHHKGIQNEKTSVTLNGIEDFSEEEKYNINNLRNWTTAKYHLCCVGTITPRKGQRIIVEALKNTNKLLLKDIFVTFIGDGPERISLEKTIVNNHLSEHTRFVGSIDNSEVYKYLHQSTIFILMSNNEGLPISIIEAMREGLPIIATRISGIPELVEEGGNGILINPDANELTNIFNNINNYNWSEMGENSRKRFEKEFTFSRMSREYCDALDTL